MTRRMGRAQLVLCLAVASGCAAPMTSYTPQHVAASELTLRYDGRVRIDAGGQPLTAGPGYEGLSEYVACVPQAYAHASKAQRMGRARRGLVWSGGALGVASLGGLSGFAFVGSDPGTAFTLLGAGLGAAALGIILAGSSRAAGNHAHGNAIDAMNFYNDAVGSSGGRCGVRPSMVETQTIVTPSLVEGPSLPPGRGVAGRAHARRSEADPARERAREGR